MVDFSFSNYVKQQRDPHQEEGEFKNYSQDKRKHAPTDDYIYRPDRDTLRAFQTMKPLNLVISALVRFWKETWRGQLLGHAVKVTSKQFPDLYRIGMECADDLHLVLPPMYVIQNPYLNAMTLGLDDDSIILIHSALIDHLDRDEIKSVVGHECGHVKNGHVLYHTVARFLGFQVAFVFQWLAKPIELLLLDWMRKSEVTADRAGLICCRDLDVSTRALVKLALGSQNLYEQIDVEEYLKQLEEIRGTVGKFFEYDQSHPFLPKRVQALRLFAESDYYQNRVLGLEKDDCLPMKELDKQVEKVIAIK